MIFLQLISQFAVVIINQQNGKLHTKVNRVRRLNSNFDFQFHTEECYRQGRLWKGNQVWMVENKKSKSLYAMKIMSKAKIIAKKSVQSVMNELQLLSQLKHNFIINMQAAFQDRDNLYLVMDLLTGGDLRYHLCKQRKFTEEQTKFFVVCIIVSLEYLHVNGILHRDVKPENLVFDDKGYLKLTDMGIARQWKPENAQDTSGTPGYMAPEVMCSKNFNFQIQLNRTKSWSGC
ncbi:unnamed protein product [Paramecium octaurelia]|uniref:non-specific serine/threonine protein kinase n=1 Tax=Paramecium octaurelia TaxID=43137 RepID=A0A8S1T1G1_PAROT|nr:unnamed protein product [Paramecium octaurelia]